jgi:GNAT superfamily N-acetyltransferase
LESQPNIGVRLAHASGTTSEASPLIGDLVVRAFDTQDAPAVSALIARTMRESNARDYPPDRLEALIAYFTPDRLRVLATERDCLVAVHRGVIIGTAARDHSELVTFFVRPESQGRGVGTTLLAALEQSARAAGVDELRVDASLTGAGFYERHGYRRTGAILSGTAGPQIVLSKSVVGAG